MSKFDSGRASNLGGINIGVRRSDSLNGIRFDSNRADPTASDDVILYRGSGSSLRWWDGSSVTTLGSAGGLVNFSLNDAYDDGRTITVDSGAVTLNATASVALALTHNDAGAQSVLTITTASATIPFSITSTNAGAVGPIIKIHHNSASQADADVIGEIQFFGNDDAGSPAENEYVTFQAVATDSGAGSEDGTLNVLMTVAGTQRTCLVVEGTTATVGSGAATGILSSSGDYDLQLQTGNSTTGTITITDGANGDIALAPNGSGNVTIADNGLVQGGTTAAACSFAVAGTSGNGFAITTATITDGTVLSVDHTSSATLNTGLLLDLLVDSSSVFKVGETGALTISGAAGTDIITVTAGDIAVDDGSVIIADNDSAPALSVTNDTNTTSDVIIFDSSAVHTGVDEAAFFNVVQSGCAAGDVMAITANALTSGTALKLDSSGTMITTGALIEMLADSATSAAGVVRMSIDGLVNGIGQVITSTSADLTSGQLLNLDHTATSASLGDKTGQLIDIVSYRDYTKASDTCADDYDTLSIVRTSINTTAGGTHTATGAALYIENVVTQTAGTMTDTTIGIEVKMDADGTGDGVQITHANTGAVALDIIGASTSVSDVLITGSGNKADNKAVLEVTSSGDTAAGSSVLRVTASGTPASNTSYLVDIDYTGATEETNDPITVHIDRGQSDEAGIQITGSVADVAHSGLISMFATQTGATGVVLHSQHTSTGSAADDDAVFSLIAEGLDSGDAVTEYGRMEVEIMNKTAGQEDGRFIFSCAADDSTLTQMVQFSPRAAGALGQVVVGSGAGAAYVTTLSTQDLILDTNEGSSSGNITITDGANGNITITPNGSGEIDLAKPVLYSSTQSITGAGTINATTSITELDTTGGGAYGLDDGVEGQLKLIVFKTDPGTDAVITPTSFEDSTITFTDAGNACTLLFTNAKWYVVGNEGGTVA